MRISQILTAVFVAALLVATVPASAATGNYTLGVQSGTTSDTYAAENLPNANVMGYDSIDLAVAALQQGDVDFVLGDLPTLKFYQADSDGLSIAGSFSEEDFGIGVAPGESDLLAAINVALGEIVDSGEYDTIFAASFGDEIVVLTDDTDADTATAYPDAENATGALAAALDAGTINFGTDPYYPPFESYIENTTDMVGFDVDMANAIAAKIGAAYGDENFSATMVEKTWDELLAFGYDNYDATLSAMTKTAQRAENTDFSRAYYSSKQGILASADSPSITGVDDLNKAADPEPEEEEDDSPSVTLVVAALTVGLIAVARRKN
ncbi:MAG: transporter substrate-binding domain-containing protein [Candidatus Thermoplasmatota archaeon]|nr:transporter substrate-binding domain-containing protein [Candidatus Thermoplasmatota archaeon]